MKKILVLLLLLSASIVVRADNEFKYTENNAGGYIFFTYSTCIYIATGERVTPNSFYVYSTNNTGQKIIEGCYEYKYPFYVINWNSGGRTVVRVETTRSIN